MSIEVDSEKNINIKVIKGMIKVLIYVCILDKMLMINKKNFIDDLYLV